MANNFSNDDIFSQFGVSPDNYEYDPVTNTIRLKPNNTFDERWNLPVQPPSDIVGSPPNVPTNIHPPNPNLYGLPVEFQKPLIDVPDNRLVNDYQVSAGVPALNKLFGVEGDRFQTWPERMAKSGVSLPADVWEGRTPVESATGYPGSVEPSVTQMEPRSIPKALGMSNFTVPSGDSVIARTQDLAGMAGMGGIGIGPTAAEATLTAGIKKLIPVIKKGEEFLKLKNNSSHDEIIGELLNGIEPKDKNIGFLDDRGRYLDRKRAFEEAYYNDLLTKEGKKHFEFLNKMNKEGDLISDFLKGTFLSEDTRAATGIGAINQSGFYSNLERTIANSKVEKATPEQWTSYLKNQPGIKGEELEFSLANLPSGQITKDQLAAHVAENGVKLGEVWKGDKTVNPKLLELDKLSRQYEREGDLVNLRVTRQQIMELENDGIGRPKYSSYQLPGGENYRELLLTVPEKKLEKWPDEPPRLLELKDKAEELGQKWSWSYNKMTEAERKDLLSERNKVDLEARDLQQKYNKQIEEIENRNREVKRDSFTTSHWDEPNVLAHIRMNDREIPGVGKSLHIEELQSDLHQAGRKQGYKTVEWEKYDNELIKLQNERDKIYEWEHKYGNFQKAADELKRLKQEKDFDNWTEGEKEAYPRILANLESKIKEPKSSNRDLTEINTEINKLYNEYTTKFRDGNQVPNFPFKKSWDELALKRMLTEAVKGGYDAISWTPGEAQAARYDLSKQVDSILYKKRDDGHYNISFKRKGSSEYEPQLVAGDKLADFVGKELAEKIVKDEGKKINTAGNNEPAKIMGEFSGLDLKVGGEGMKGFYDVQEVNKANSIVKKMGGKVELNVEAPISGGKPGQVYIDQYGNKVKENPKVHVIKITPQMREKIKNEGFSLFTAPQFIPIDHDPFEKKLVPVAHNPFINLVPVEHNPFQ